MSLSKPKELPFLEIKMFKIYMERITSFCKNVDGAWNDFSYIKTNNVICKTSTFPFLFIESLQYDIELIIQQKFYGNNII